MTTPLFQIPKPIMENMEKLNELVEKYPLDIPVPEVAKLMGMKPECLRAAIDCGTFKPGYSWRKGVAQNKGYKIATKAEGAEKAVCKAVQDYFRE